MINLLYISNGTLRRIEIMLYEERYHPDTKHDAVGGISANLRCVREEIIARKGLPLNLTEKNFSPTKGQSPWNNWGNDF